MTEPVHAPWEQQLWAEIEALPIEQRVIVYAEAIMYITRELLSKLGDRRRELILQMLDQPDMDAMKVAELIGSRRKTVQRLADEGRQRLRSKG